MTSADRLLRAMTDDASFRVIVADTTDTVRGVVASQGASGEVAMNLARLVTGTVMFRETMSPQYRVQGILRAGGETGTGTLIADSLPTGAVRGLVQPRDTHVTLGAGARLQLMRSLPNGSLNQGVVELSPPFSLSHAFMAYMQSSEQVVSMLAVDAIDKEGEVVRSGGYLVQLLPGAATGTLAVMTERLHDFETIEPLLRADNFSTDTLLEELLYGMPFTRLGESSTHYDCWCDEARVVGALATLQKSDLEELVKGGENLQIDCEYCRKEYRIAPSRLRGMLGSS